MSRWSDAGQSSILRHLRPPAASVGGAKRGRASGLFRRQVARCRSLCAPSNCRSVRSIGGPAILEQQDATIIVEPDLQARVDVSATSSSSGGPHDRSQHIPKRSRWCSSICRTTSFIPSGAYARGGARRRSDRRVARAVEAGCRCVRAEGGWIVSTHFTLVPGKGGEPFISPHLKALRPFLRKGDFAPGGWGHALVDELQPADLSVEKVAFSAFYMSRLEWVLRKAGIETLVFSGIVTNGGVASTCAMRTCAISIRVLLEDGCAAFSEETSTAPASRRFARSQRSRRAPTFIAALQGSADEHRRARFVLQRADRGPHACRSAPVLAGSSPR